jgi:hypothetical protein
MAMRMRRDLLVTAIGAIPFIGVWLMKVIIHPRPFWAHYADPEMFFFYDGLRLHNGWPPANIDHPGTPIQLLAAAVISLTGPHPLLVDRYRLGMYIVTGLLTIVALLLLVRSGVLRDVPPLLQIVALWSLWLAPASLRHLAIASPESIELPFAVLAMMAIVAFARDPTRRKAALCGAAIGACIGVKFVFLAWLLAAGLAALIAGGATLRTRISNAFVIGASSIAGFAAATCAAAARWPDMFRWVLSLATHSRWYGTGPIAYTNPLVYIHTFAVAIGSAKTWHLWLFAALAAMLVRWLRNRREAFLPLFCLAAVIVNYAMAAKGLLPTADRSYGDIPYRYLLPVAFVALIAFADACHKRAPARSLQIAIAIVVAVLVFKAAAGEVKATDAILADERRARANIDSAIAAHRRPGDVVIYGECPEPSFALRFPTYDRRFLMEAVARSNSADVGPVFNESFLRMVEQRYPDEGHYYANVISLPTGHHDWDLMAISKGIWPSSPAAGDVVVARPPGFVIVRNRRSMR